MSTVLIMAGGTGGHIIPALAVAAELRQRGVEVHWLGALRGLEAELVPASGIPIDYIKIQGVRRTGLLGLALAPLRMAQALWQAVRHIRRIKPDLVLGFGGFVSGPGGVAAWLLRKPLVIHEQNARAGFTNRWLAKMATRVLQAFPQTFPARYRALTLGNPVRTAIVALEPPRDRLAKHGDQPLHLLVLGGSQGAAIFNELLPQAIQLMPATQRPLIKHIAGKNKTDAATLAYAQAGINAEIFAFTEDMAAMYGWADVVVSRAGASTVSELAAAGIASVLVPFPYAVDDHQTHNAAFLADAEAALLRPQRALTARQLAEDLSRLSMEREVILQMSMTARNLRVADSARQVAEVCLSLLQIPPHSNPPPCRESC